MDTYYRKKFGIASSPQYLELKNANVFSFYKLALLFISAETCNM